MQRNNAFPSKAADPWRMASITKMAFRFICIAAIIFGLGINFVISSRQKTCSQNGLATQSMTQKIKSSNVFVSKQFRDVNLLIRHYERQ